MGDNSEYRLLSISIRKPPKYGSFLSKDSTQRQNFLTHDVQKDETLQGIALKYGVTVSLCFLKSLKIISIHFLSSYNLLTDGKD